MLMHELNRSRASWPKAATRGTGLNARSGLWALTAMGIGAIIGTGIFVLDGRRIGDAAGPALTISFVIAGIVSALAALCYAEVSSKFRSRAARIRMPIPRSASSLHGSSDGHLYWSMRSALRP